MTLPDERYRAIEQTRRLLWDLADPKATPGVSASIRERARGCLRHFPDPYDMIRAATAAPDVFQERMEPVSRLLAQYEQSQNKKS